MREENTGVGALRPYATTGSVVTARQAAATAAGNYVKACDTQTEEGRG